MHNLSFRAHSCLNIAHGIFVYFVLQKIISISFSFGAISAGARGRAPTLPTAASVEVLQCHMLPLFLVVSPYCGE